MFDITDGNEQLATYGIGGIGINSPDIMDYSSSCATWIFCGTVQALPSAPF